MGGGSYSYDWSNSVRNRKIAGSGYYQTGDSHKYAKYDIQKGPLIPQISLKNLYNEDLTDLINQYKNLKVETSTCKLYDLRYKELIQLIGKILKEIKNIDNEQFLKMQEKYDELLQEYSYNNKSYLEQINKKYTQPIDKKPILTLNPYGNEFELYSKIGNFTQWLDDILKFYGLYPKNEETNPVTVLKQQKLTIFAKIKQLFLKLFQHNTNKIDSSNAQYELLKEKNFSTLQSIKQQDKKFTSTNAMQETNINHESKEQNNDIERGNL